MVRFLLFPFVEGASNPFEACSAEIAGVARSVDSIEREVASVAVVRPRSAPAPEPGVLGRVREGILAQHRAIERILSCIDSLVRQAELGDAFTSFVAPKLAQLTGDLSAELRAHLSYENRYLLPTIRVLDGSAERSERIYAEHLEQRDRVDELMRLLCTPSTADSVLVEVVSEFASELRSDMEREERGILAEAALCNAARSRSSS